MTHDSLKGVFAVPPLARKATRAIDLEQNSRIVRVRLMED